LKGTILPFWACPCWRYSRSCGRTALWHNRDHAGSWTHRLHRNG
jgi:hypothetical protein